MMHNKVSAKTRTVWWDMNCCQIPPGYDLYQVRPNIESALEKYFRRPGPLTIIAIGNIKHIPRRVLEPISASGIYIKHGALGVIDICMEIHLWAPHNPPPATIMVISDNDSEECLKYSLPYYRDKGYTILRASLNHQGRKPKYASKMWLWKSLLTDAMDSGSADTKQESRRQKCIGTGQPAWFCRLCDVAAQSFDNFTTHLEGQKHALNEYGMVQRDLTALPENATNFVKKQPEDQVRKRLPLILNPRMLLNMVKKRPKQVLISLKSERFLMFIIVVKLSLLKM